MTWSAPPTCSGSSASSPPPSRRIGARRLVQALSPNGLQRAYHPWTSYVIVPLFALANAGIEISSEFPIRAATSPITLGIVSGYVSASRSASLAPPGSSAG